MSETTIEFSTDLEPEEDEPTLSVQEARKILLTKIGNVPNYSGGRGGSIVGDIWKSIKDPHQFSGVGTYGEDAPPNDQGARKYSPSRTLADKLAQILPPEMMKRSILEGGDVRSLLAKIMISPDTAERGDTFSINGVEFTANERSAAGLILVDATEAMDESYENFVRANNQNDEIVDEVLESWRAEALYSYRDGVMRSDLPVSQESYGTGKFERDENGDLQPVGGSTPVTDAATAGDYDTTGAGGGGINVYKFMNQEEVDNLFATTYDTNMAVQGIYRSEQEQIDRANMPDPQTGETGQTFGGQVQVQYDDKDKKDVQMGLAPGVGTNTEMKKATGKAAELLTLSQMAKKPQEMTRQQVVNLSKKMEQAGIYEIVGEKPMIPGDWTDSAFKKGFEALMGLAVQKNVSMTALLQGRTSTYQKSLEDAMSTRLTDPARIRMSVDDTARSMLGRHLSPEEHVEFTEFVHGLERRNAKVESGLDTSTEVGGIDDLDEGIIADIDARLSDKIREDNVTEFSAERVQDQYDAFSEFLAGPGRGGSF